MKASCYPFVTASYRSNSYGLSSDNAFKLLKYYRKCLKEYAGCSSATIFFTTFGYIFLTIIKKKFVKIYNSVVVFL